MIFLPGFICVIVYYTIVYTTFDNCLLALPRWRNWQTRQLEGLVGVILCWFKSSPGQFDFAKQKKQSNRESKFEKVIYD